jgi:predicted anti-sigma-YlaC factor YlaD
MNTPSASRAIFIQAAIAVNGLNYFVVGLLLVFAPRWFFDNVGNFPPFNRHYSGDLGTFLLPLGIGLLWAARDPARRLGLIGVALAGSWLHVLNHLYDDLTAGALSAQFLSNTLPLLALAILLSAAYFAAGRQGNPTQQDTL